LLLLCLLLRQDVTAIENRDANIAAAKIYLAEIVHHSSCQDGLPCTGNART
jgi:hypothetical protein